MPPPHKGTAERTKKNDSLVPSEPGHSNFIIIVYESHTNQFKFIEKLHKFQRRPYIDVVLVYVEKNTICLVNKV